MNAQQVMMDSRLLHVRELRAEVARLKEENHRLKTESESLSRHFDLAILAAEDLRTLPPDGRFIIVDGWNLILGANREAPNPMALIERVRGYLAANPQDFVWIVFDGAKENARVEGRMRLSYTGGTGLHRADRFICDFLRMARFRGELSRISVKTSDKDFAREVVRLGATTEACHF